MRIGVNVHLWQFECCGDRRDGAWFGVDDDVSWLLTIRTRMASSEPPASHVTLRRKRTLRFEHHGEVGQYEGPDGIWGYGTPELPSVLHDPEFDEDHHELVLEDHLSGTETRGTIVRIRERRQMYAEAGPMEWLPVAGSQRLAEVRRAVWVDDMAEPAPGGHYRFVGWHVDLETRP
jgi:hypothetical protein